MISVEKALEEILQIAVALPAETKPIEVLLGHPALPYHLARAVRSNRDIPAWANSAMDGFAVQFADVHRATTQKPAELSITGEIRAGQPSDLKLSKGCAIRIMTGAPVPEGADTVVPVEETKALNSDKIAILRSNRKGEHIRLPGEDVRSGTVVFEEGAPLNPATLAVLASIGAGEVSVVQKPRVAILPTGDELVPYTEIPKHAQIVDSNSLFLRATLGQLGCEAKTFQIVDDRPQALEGALGEAFRDHDVVVTCGGVSVGAYDFVQDALKGNGGEVVFWGVSIKPGKPFLFGRVGRKLFFGLPGNPASVSVTFEMFVRPALLQMAGDRHPHRPQVEAIAAEDLRGALKRTTVARVSLRQENGRWSCSSSGHQGSHVLSTVAQANGLAVIPLGTERVKKGEPVWVRHLT